MLRRGQDWSGSRRGRTPQKAICFVFKRVRRQSPSYGHLRRVPRHSPLQRVGMGCALNFVPHRSEGLCFGRISRITYEADREPVGRELVRTHHSPSVHVYGAPRVIRVNARVSVDAVGVLTSLQRVNERRLPRSRGAKFSAVRCIQNDCAGWVCGQNLLYICLAHRIINANEYFHEGEYW